MKLSVVMAVYNGEATIERAIESILSQSERSFELIVVNDGSTDTTRAILDRFAAHDSRVRVLDQPNRGLTSSLIRGCAEARAPVIARHDADDVSLRDRFARQLEVLIDPDVAAASCWTRWVGPEGELLYEIKPDGEEVRRSLLEDPSETIRGIPGHGSAMFRTADYIAVGGYRDAFWFAQDLDLWIRLAARGRIAFVPAVLYEVRYAPGDISAERRSDQFALARISTAIRDGGDVNVLLDEARRVKPVPIPRSRRNRAKGLYFIASCLRRNGDERFRRYAREAVAADPLNLRAWLLLLR